MKKALLAVVAAGLVAVMSAVYWPVEACVGKTVFLGRMPGREQEVLTEMFSWMVSERTGTTIQIKALPDSRTMHAALQTADVDLYLEDQGVALREILGQPAAGTGADQRETVRREYEQRFNLIWLEPWGMTGRPAPATVRRSRRAGRSRTRGSGDPQGHPEEVSGAQPSGEQALPAWSTTRRWRGSCRRARSGRRERSSSSFSRKSG